LYCFGDDGWVAAKLPAPKLIAEHHDAARLLFLRRKTPAQCWSDSQRRYQVRCYARGRDALRLTASR